MFGAEFELTFASVVWGLLALLASLGVAVLFAADDEDDV